MEQLKLDVITKAIDDKKGEDIQIIETKEKSPFFDYVVVATVQNSRQASSIADEIEEKLSLIKETVHHVEGNTKESEWLLVDCNDIIVHLFSSNERLRVNIEELLTGKNNGSRKGS